MNSKPNLNTVLLLLILVALVGGGLIFFGSVWRLAQPLEEAEQVLRERFTELTNPTPTIIPDPVTIVRQVRSLSRLETSSYTIEKVITAESGQTPLAFLFGDRLILVARGQVIAGVDLGKIGDGDIRIAGDGMVVVTLPPAEIFVATLDNQKSYVVDRDTALIGLNPALETEARQAAEEEILKAALEDGILQMAQRNAETYVRQLILALGFREVVFTQPEEAPVLAATPTATP